MSKRRSSLMRLWAPFGSSRNNMQDPSPPPAYAPYPSAPPQTDSFGGMREPYDMPLPAQAPADDDDPYAFLSSFDTAFIIDDSGSMSGSRWKEVDTCLSQIAPVCTAHDEDGIDVYFLNHRAARTASPAGGKGPSGYVGLTTAAHVQKLFHNVRPSGSTMTGSRLRSVLDPYMALLEAHAGRLEAVKPLNVIVFTDGEAQDDPESVIVQTARRLDRLDAPLFQLGIQFFQIGNDPTARAALQDLDDAISAREQIRDIVDTVTWPADQRNTVLTPDLVLKTVLGAVVRRLDRQNYSYPWLTNQVSKNNGKGR